MLLIITYLQHLKDNIFGQVLISAKFLPIS